MTFELILAVLATYRLTYLLMYEDGPWDLVAKFRKLIGVKRDEQEGLAEDEEPTGLVSKLFSCLYCLSVWTSVPVLITMIYAPYLLWPFALSAGAIMIDSYVDR